MGLIIYLKSLDSDCSLLDLKFDIVLLALSCGFLLIEFGFSGDLDYMMFMSLIVCVMVL